MKPRISLPRVQPASPYICSHCRLSCISRPSQAAKHGRTFATSSPPSPPKTGYALLSSRRLISLSGPDSTHFLQGVITANLSPKVPRNTGFYAAFLNAQGRLLNDVFIYPALDGGEGWLIEVDAKEAERLAKHIKRYKLRAKFEVRVLEQDQLAVWSVWDESAGDSSSRWIAHSLDSNLESVPLPGNARGCYDTRAPGMGRRLLLSGDQNPEVDFEPSTEDAYRIRRYLKGVPEGQDELLREQALPQESNVDFMGGIDYRKGCYVGQELTIRTHHTGVVRKRILPVMIYPKDEPMPGVLEYRPDADGVDAGAIPRETSIGRFAKRGRGAGKWLAGIGNIGLGLCRLEIMTGLQVGGEMGGWKEEDEFKLEWEVDGSIGTEGEGTSEMVKIKAFVPGWHLKN